MLTLDDQAAAVVGFLTLCKLAAWCELQPSHSLPFDPAKTFPAPVNFCPLKSPTHAKSNAGGLMLRVTY